MICFRLRHQLKFVAYFALTEACGAKPQTGLLEQSPNAIDESGDVGYNVAGLKCPCPSGGGDGKDAGV
jgi:hypothetical protein